MVSKTRPYHVYDDKIYSIYLPNERKEGNPNKFMKNYNEILYISGLGVQVCTGTHSI